MVDLAKNPGICLELRKRGAKRCGFHPFPCPDTAGQLPHKGVDRCPFLRGRLCFVSEHNRAVRRAWDAGQEGQPLSTDLLPTNYRLPFER